MAYIIRAIGEKNGTVKYESEEVAKEYAMMNLENYEHGFEIVDEDGNICYSDRREEVSRTDLIDWD